jgi:predicted  nucleic acid-binding Zn-ribbon protein
MPVYLCVTRRAQCCICGHIWVLDGLEDHPDKCPCCGTLEWEFGPECEESKLIRQRFARRSRILNPGAASKKRQDRARAQYQQFKDKN